MCIWRGDILVCPPPLFQISEAICTRFFFLIKLETEEFFEEYD
jgi:hypothetical protein